MAGLVKKRTRPPLESKREILNGIYQFKGCNWGDLPKDLPPYSTMFWYYKQWRKAEVLEGILTTLHGKVRQQVKKTAMDGTLQEFSEEL